MVILTTNRLEPCYKLGDLMAGREIVAQMASIQTSLGLTWAGRGYVICIFSLKYIQDDPVIDFSWHGDQIN